MRQEGDSDDSISSEDERPGYRRQVRTYLCQRGWLQVRLHLASLHERRRACAKAI